MSMTNMSLKNIFPLHPVCVWSRQPLRPPPQVLLYVSLHLTAATLSGMSGDGGREVKELWKAAAWLRDGEHFSLSAQLCSLMFPDGESPRTETSRTC